MRTIKNNFLKFKKAHDIGIEKGAIKSVTKQFAKRMIDDGYAEAITKKEYEKHIDDLAKQGVDAAQAYENMAAKRNKNREKRLVKRGRVEKVGATPEETKQDKPENKNAEFVEVDKIDFEANEAYSEQGIKIGDKVLFDTETGQPVMDQDGKFTVEKAEKK